MRATLAVSGKRRYASTRHFHSLALRMRGTSGSSAARRLLMQYTARRAISAAHITPPYHALSLYRLYSSSHYSALVGMRSIAMSVSVCLSVCLSVSLLCILWLWFGSPLAALRQSVFTNDVIFARIFAHGCMSIPSQRVTSLRRRAQDNAPTVSHWSRRVRQDGGC